MFTCTFYFLLKSVGRLKKTAEQIVEWKVCTTNRMLASAAAAGSWVSVTSWECNTRRCLSYCGEKLVKTLVVYIRVLLSFIARWSERIEPLLLQLSSAELTSQLQCNTTSRTEKTVWIIFVSPQVHLVTHLLLKWINSWKQWNHCSVKKKEKQQS